MSDSLDIDIERLITSVQSRVVLWDKTNEKYKDKFKTLEAENGKLFVRKS